MAAIDLSHRKSGGSSSRRADAVPVRYQAEHPAAQSLY